MSEVNSAEETNRRGRGSHCDGILRFCIERHSRIWSRLRLLEQRTLPSRAIASRTKFLRGFGRRKSKGSGGWPSMGSRSRTSQGAQSRLLATVRQAGLSKPVVRLVAQTESSGNSERRLLAAGFERDEDAAMSSMRKGNRPVLPSAQRAAVWRAVCRRSSVHDGPPGDDGPSGEGASGGLAQHLGQPAGIGDLAFRDGGEIALLGFGPGRRDVTLDLGQAVKPFIPNLVRL